MPEQLEEALEPTIQHQPALEDPKQPQSAAELQVPKTTEVGGTTKE
jgi:hypothetical protein